MSERDQQSSKEEASIMSFPSDIAFLIDKTNDANNENGPLSLKKIGEYFRVLHAADQTFAKVVANISGRSSEQEEKLVSCYLKRSTLYLGLLNSVTSCLFHLGESRIRLLNGLSLMETSPADALTSLKPIALKHVEEESEVFAMEGEDDEDLKEVGWVWFWVCYTALAGLSDDSEKWVEKRRKVCLLSASAGKDDGGGVKDIVEINKVVKLLSDVADGKDLFHESERVRRMVEVLGNELDVLLEESNTLFFHVLGVRDKLIDTIRVSFDAKP